MKKINTTIQKEKLIKPGGKTRILGGAAADVDIVFGGCYAGCFQRWTGSSGAVAPGLV
jgi:hypothetical protein